MKSFNSLKLLVFAVIIVLQIYAFVTHSYKYSFIYNILIFSTFALFALFLERKYLATGFLLSTFALMTSWRLSVLSEMHYAIDACTVAFAVILVHFISIARSFYRKNSKVIEWKSSYNWQLSFIRIYVGFNLIPDFCTKLFAGEHYRGLEISETAKLGVSDPTFMILLAGVIEFLGSLFVSCGLMTRLTSLLLFIYFITAMMIGQHFERGFLAWGGLLLWCSIILSFAFFKANSFSIDSDLKARFRKLPRFVEFFLR